MCGCGGRGWWTEDSRTLLSFKGVGGEEVAEGDDAILKGFSVSQRSCAVIFSNLELWQKP